MLQTRPAATALGDRLPAGDRGLESAADIPLMLRQFSLGRATELARAGHYEASEALLAPLMQDPLLGICALDLQARIHAQRGRFRQADEAWRLVLEIAPQNKDGLSGVAAIERVRRRPVWITAAAALVGWFVVLGTLAGIFLYISHRFNALQGSINSIAAAAMARSLAANSTAATSSQVRLPDVQVPGTKVIKEANVMEIEFENGLFLHGTTFRSDAKSELSQLAQQLRPFQGSISITIAGSTDQLPVRAGSRYSDNLALGLARAESVLRQLVSSGLDVNALNLKRISAPFPNDPSENRNRNKTVSILVSPRQE